MVCNQTYLILLVAIVGVTWSYPYNNQYHYKVVWTGDDEQPGTHHDLLGQKMCTRGPAYWCHNITQAAECHAMQHCIKKVWENPKDKLPQDNDSVCEVCLDMVKQARDQLLSNETQDELRQVFEGSCNLLPIKLVAKECRELADNFIPELIDALTSRMDPQMVCHISGLCNSVRIDEMLEEMKEIDGPKKIKPLDPLKFDTCPECTHYVGEFVNQLKRLTKDDLKVQLLAFCGHLGSFSDSCKQAVIHETDAIYEYLQKNMQPKDLCGLIGLCVESNIHRVPLQGGPQQSTVSMTSVRVWQPPMGNKDDLECDFCKQLTESVRQWLVANNTEEEFQKVLEGLCKQTGKYRQECLSLAEQYGKQIYQTLVDDLNPDEVCQSIGICHSSLLGANRAKYAPVWTILATDDDDKKPQPKEDEDDFVPLMKLQPSERLTGDDEMKPTANKAECEFCQYTLHYLQLYLDNATTEAEIKKEVDRLCTEYIPKRFADQCKSFVDQYGEALVTLLAQEADPSQVCPKLHLCPAVTTPKPRVTALGQPAPNMKDILPTCALCTFTIEKIIHLVGKNMTKQSVDAAMEGICEYIPKRMEEECLAFMKNYGDEAAEMILVYGTSHGVCAALHLCLMSPAPTNPKTVVMNAQLPLDRYVPQTVTLDEVSQLDLEKDDSRRCVMCEFVITTLDQRLQDNATEEEIKQEVEHICSYLPKTVRGKCEVFVDNYGEQIIQYLSQEIDPEDICTRIGLCQPQKPKNDNIRKLNMDRCQLCMLVSNYLGSILAEEDSDKKIDDLAQRTCAMVPKAYRTDCTALIEDYGPYLVNILEDETDNGKVCAQIQLCPNGIAGNELALGGEDDGFEY